MKRTAAKIFVTFLVSMLPSFLFAQGCVGGIDPGCSPDDFCPCPIDSNIYILVGAALLVFAWKSFSGRKAAAQS